MMSRITPQPEIFNEERKHNENAQNASQCRPVQDDGNTEDGDANSIAQNEQRPSPYYTDRKTSVDQYIVEFYQNDSSNPQNFSQTKKWGITSIVTLSVLAVTLTSSAYSGSHTELNAQFASTSEEFTLGIALYVLGFAIGPPLWAPLSELWGRRKLFIGTHVVLVAFVAGAAASESMAQILVFRLLAGMFGASPLTNSGGVIADLFAPAQRGLGMTIFSAAPFMGPVLGPIVGGFVSENIGWRWVQGVCSIFIGVVLLMGALLIPETYGPVILRWEAERLSRETGKPYVSALVKGTNKSWAATFGRCLARPWLLLFCEPIVLAASIYLAILYGTLYMFMSAFPIVYQGQRGWSEGIGGLAFLGLAVGMLLGLAYTIFDNKRYKRLGQAAIPEDRLWPGIIGAVALPIGMFSFAWTNGPNFHWSASIILSAPFGFGCVLVFIACLNYLVDAYAIYAASVLAAGQILRSLFGFAFPLFTTQMYENLGIHWASSVPAFLTVACLPFPLIVYLYGAKLRVKCKYAKEAELLLARLRTEKPVELPPNIATSPV